MTPPVEDVLEDVVTILGSITSSSFLEEPTIESGGENGLLKVSLLFTNGNRLFVSLYIDISSGFPLWQRYSFQFVDVNGQNIIRFDNAPHYHSLPHFPHHKHIGLHRIEPTPQPSLKRIVDEIFDYGKGMRPL